MTQLVPGAWHKAVRVEETPLVVTEGDGLHSLREIRQKYYSHANNIVRRRTDQETGQLPAKYHSIIEWYRQQGDRVNLLLPEDREYLNVSGKIGELEVSGTFAVVDEARAVEHVPVEPVQEDSPSVSEDVSGPAEGSVGYGVDYLSRPGETGLGEIIVEVPMSGLPGTDTIAADGGPSKD